MKHLVSVVKPEVLVENKLTINTFIKESYTQAKQQVQGGMHYLKDEFNGLYDKTSGFIHQFILPVNNFLKDFNQIENEFRLECGVIPALPCHVPVAVAILSDEMEENY